MYEFLPLYFAVWAKMWYVPAILLVLGLVTFIAERGK